MLIIHAQEEGAWALANVNCLRGVDQPGNSAGCLDSGMKEAQWQQGEALACSFSSALVYLSAESENSGMPVFDHPLVF